MKLVAIVCSLIIIPVFGKEKINVLTGEQIYRTISLTSGFSLQKNKEFFNIYSIVKDSLPRKGVLSEINKDFHKGMIQLAWKACEIIYKREIQGQLSLYKGVNPSKKLKEYSNKELNFILRNLSFWLWDIDISKKNINQLFELTSKISKIKLENGQELIMLCSSFYSSPNFYLY